MIQKATAVIFLLFCSAILCGQGEPDSKYWNDHSQLIPWRIPIPSLSAIKYEDLDKDGDPDIIRFVVNDSIPVIWIDDDDDMSYGDIEGDIDNDCICADLNRDGLFGGPDDLCLDWTDTDNDGIADIQAVVINGNLNLRNYFDWGADLMYIIDYGEKDGIMNFIDWNDILLRAWEHSGHSNFYTDYHGNTLFIKMHGSTFRIEDLSYSWENPFIFFDPDKDNLSEMAIRLVDTPEFRPKPGEEENPHFESVSPEYDIIFKKRIDYAAITWDLDNDNGQGNEFDFDMSLKFSGKGFGYEDQVHRFSNMRGLPDADKLFYDPRWRQNDILIYPDQKVAYNKIFREGKWNYCWFVFDEDDDCNRWERVEFYEPRDLWKIGMEKGGIDNNKQADAVGDRGEFDSDNSGGGKLYIAPFDGRLHLYGAEWGVWRIDLNASTFQGYGGLYPPAKQHVRDQKEPQKWATVRYSDTDMNGFFDCIEYNLDGDTIFEEKISLREMGIEDKGPLINTGKTDYKSLNRIFHQLAEKIWDHAAETVRISGKNGINPEWYSFWRQPRTLYEKYQYGFWLAYYLYRDLRYVAEMRGNHDLVQRLDKAYYSGNWDLLNN